MVFVPTTANGYAYLVANVFNPAGGVVGVTGATEPNWPTALGGTVLDGDVLWACVTFVGTDLLSVTGNALSGLSDLSKLPRSGLPQNGWQTYNADPG
jgi:hypothetical protein